MLEGAKNLREAANSKSCCYVTFVYPTIVNTKT